MKGTHMAEAKNLPGTVYRTKRCVTISCLQPGHPRMQLLPYVMLDSPPKELKPQQDTSPGPQIAPE